MEPEINEPEYSEPASIDDLEPGDDVDLDEENNEGSSSLYYQKVERKQKAWENLRKLTIKKALQFAGKSMKTNKCVLCGALEGNFKCTDCGPVTRFCEECMLKMHTNTNIFHRVEIFKVMILLEISLPWFAIFKIYSVL